MTEYTVPKDIDESAAIPARDSDDPAANATHLVTLKDPDLQIEKRFRCEKCGRWERSIIRFEFEPCLPDADE